jgi:hypothetical protein
MRREIDVGIKQQPGGSGAPCSGGSHRANAAGLPGAWRRHHRYAYELAEATEEPRLVGRYIEDKNGHILPYVHFEGGQLRLVQSALQLLDELAGSRP